MSDYFHHLAARALGLASPIEPSVTRFDPGLEEPAPSLLMVELERAAQEPSAPVAPPRSLGRPTPHRQNDPSPEPPVHEAPYSLRASLREIVRESSFDEPPAPRPTSLLPQRAPDLSGEGIKPTHAASIRTEKVTNARARSLARTSEASPPQPAPRPSPEIPVVTKEVPTGGPDTIALTSGESAGTFHSTTTQGQPDADSPAPLRLSANHIHAALPTTVNATYPAFTEPTETSREPSRNSAPKGRPSPAKGDSPGTDRPSQHISPERATSPATPLVHSTPSADPEGVAEDSAGSKTPGRRPHNIPTPEGSHPERSQSAIPPSVEALLAGIAAHNAADIGGERNARNLPEEGDGNPLPLRDLNVRIDSVEIAAPPRSHPPTAPARPHTTLGEYLARREGVGR